MRGDKTDTPAFAAADRTVFVVFHFHDCIAQVGQQATNRCLHLRIVAQGARIVDADLGVGMSGEGGGQAAVLEHFVHGAHGQALAILVEDRGAVGAGSQHGVDTVKFERLDHRVETCVKRGVAAQIVGGLGAAAKQKAKRRNALAEMVVDLQGNRGAGTGKRAAGKEHSGAFPRNRLQGKKA
jgi:hypothetical protein